jgi:hypothetical protein
MQVLVRLCTRAEGTDPALTDMTFTYLGAASTPDRWTLVGPAGEWSLDPAVRRYGSQSLRCQVIGATTGNRYIIPWRKTTGDDIPVLPETTYTFSAFVKTDGLMTGGALSLYIFQAGSTSVSRVRSSPVVYDTTGLGNDGWLRISCRYTTAPGETAVRPMIHYNRLTANNETFWIDGAKFEEGTVASAWTPGFVGEPTVLDANGIVVDAFSGGIFRLRGSTGTARDSIELGPHGLLFTDTELYSKNAAALWLPNVDGPGAYAQRALVMLSGGGTVTLSAGNVLSWTARFMPISEGLDPLLAASGYFEILQPPNGTVIPGVGGASDATVTAAGVPMTGAYKTLWYILPFGSGPTSLSANFRISDYTGAFVAPSNWIAIARISDGPVMWLANGMRLKAGQSQAFGAPAPIDSIGSTELAPATYRHHMVAIDPYFGVIDPANYSAATALQSTEITAIPANLVGQVWAQCYISCAHSAGSAGSIEVRHYGGGYAMNAGTQATAGRYGHVASWVKLGGTNNRQVQWLISQATATLTAYLRVTAYATVAD